MAEENEKECVICRDGEETPENKLVSPCLCKGTMMWRHQECLRNWVRVSKSLVCSECSAAYEMEPVEPGLHASIRYLRTLGDVMGPELRTLGRMTTSLVVELLDPYLEEWLAPYVSRGWNAVMLRLPYAVAHRCNRLKDVFLWVTNSFAWEFGWGMVALMESYQTAVHADHQWALLGPAPPAAIIGMNPILPLTVGSLAGESIAMRGMMMQIGLSMLMIVHEMPAIVHRVEDEMELHPWKVDIETLVFIDKP